MKAIHLRIIAAAIAGHTPAARRDLAAILSVPRGKSAHDPVAEEIFVAVHSDPVDADRLVSMTMAISDRCFLRMARECMIDLACTIDSRIAPAPLARYWTAVVDGLLLLARHRGVDEELGPYTEGAAYAIEIGLHEQYGPLLSPVPRGHVAMRGEPEALREGQMLDRVRFFLAQLAEHGKGEPWTPDLFH